MIILALDCSTTVGSFSLLKNGNELASAKWSNERSHGEVVIATISEKLKEAGVALDEIDLFAATVGPGRFTGIRVGLNVIRSLAYAFNKPVAAVDSLTVLAQNASDRDTPVACMLNAFRNSVFISLFERGPNRELIPTAEPQAVPVVELRDFLKEAKTPYLALGDGLTAYASVLDTETKGRLIRDQKIADHPSAFELARLAAAGPGQRVKISDWKGLSPLYIRASEAEERLSTLVRLDERNKPPGDDTR